MGFMELKSVPKSFRDLNLFIRTSTNYQTAGECVLYVDGYQIKAHPSNDRVVIYKFVLCKDEEAPKYEYLSSSEYTDFEDFKTTEEFKMLVASLDGNPDSSWMDKVSFESTTTNNSTYVLEYEFVDNSPYVNGWCYSTTPAELEINLFSSKLKIAYGPDVLEATYQDIFTGVRLLEQLRSNGFEISSDSLSFNFGDKYPVDY